jgi:adenylosuccinate lyase
VDYYESPFSTRYASKEMSYLFSSDYRTLLFRKLWIALAKGEKQLGLPITDGQISSMIKHFEEIDHNKIAFYEKKFRHDIMAHIHAFGDLAPSAKPIIHLGATSTFVTDNGDLIQMREALDLLFSKLLHVLKLLANFAKKQAKAPCVGYTHFQPAQPTTIGKRACLWLQDFLMDAHEWKRQLENLPFLGVKGATGTQSSFLLLFKGNENKIKKLESIIAKEFGLTKVLPISGQTYTRKLDLHLLNALGSFAASVHKMATDFRLLAHEGELVESFDKTQIGSSAMPYKQNPIYAERICGIARFVMSLNQNPAYTLATQWLERSLDDSSNKRLSIPEAFLGTDALLNLLSHLLSKVTARQQISLKKVQEQSFNFLLENILMESSLKGEDRQELHEKLKKLSIEAKAKKEPLGFLLQKIENDSGFHLTSAECKKLLSIEALIGRSEIQVKEFLKDEVFPFLLKHKGKKTGIPKVEI